MDLEYLLAICDHKLVQSNPFKVQTLGGEVTIDIQDPTSAITVDMGSVRFADDVIKYQRHKLSMPHCRYW